VGSPRPAKRHYAPSEVAERWNLNVETIRRLFQDEPGVLVFQAPARKGRRGSRPSGYRKVSLIAFTNGCKLRNMHTLCSGYTDAM